MIQKLSGGAGGEVLKSEALPEAPNIVSWYAAVFSSLGHLVPLASDPHSLGTTQWRCRKQREKGWGKPVLP